MFVSYIDVSYKVVSKMPRPPIKFFVNRKSILSTLTDTLLHGDNILLLGLRGYGKSVLASKLVDLLEKKGIKTLFIDCLKIVDPKSLFDEAVRDWKLLNRADKLVFKRANNAREVIDAFFETIIQAGVKILVLDEITTFLERFGELKPFSDVNGAKAVAGYIKEFLDSDKIGILASDTSIGAIYDLILSYSSPLLKSFQRVLYLDPLEIPYAAELLTKIMESKGKKISQRTAIYVANLLYGVPQYIVFAGQILPNNPTIEEVENTIIDELQNGFFNVYFTLFLEKFSPEQKGVLYAIGRGSRTFSAISKQFTSINTVRALKKLVISRIIRKTEKGRRRVEYSISDKVFETWLKLNIFPELRIETSKRILISSLSFESYVREILSSLTNAVEITDAKGEKLIIPRLERVERLSKGDVEIDILGIVEKNKVLVGECYFGEKAGIKKAQELEKGVLLIKKLGYSIEYTLIFSYFGFDDALIQYAEERNIFLLEAKQMRKLAKKAQIPAI